MKEFFPDLNVIKLLLDSAHDAMPIYEYCRKKKLTPFIALNEKRGIHVKLKEEFILEKDGISVCPAGLRMHRDGSEPKKYRLKFRYPMPVAQMAAHVKRLAQRPNTEGPSMSLLKTTRVCSIYHQGKVRSGKQTLMQEPLLNAPISVKNRLSFGKRQAPFL